MTEDGWVDVTASNKTVKYEVFEIRTETGRILLCADNHILICQDGRELFAKDSFGEYVRTEHGGERIVFVQRLGRSEHMYDLSVGGRHLYYTNGFLSHNTSVNTAVILHFILFNEHKNVAIIANKAKTAREILNRVKIAYEHLPKWLQQGVVEWNKSSVSLENGCVVFADSPTANSIRGFSISLLFIDEVAFIPRNVYDEFFKSVFPTISSGQTTRIFMVSTPNGRNHFYDMVSKARKKKSEFFIQEFDWRVVPGRDEEWKRKEISNTSELQFRQEYECVTGETMVKIRDKVTGEIKSVRMDSLVHM